jgi:hypothetical protein
MSYKLGAKAFLDRFKKFFPENEFTWVEKKYADSPRTRWNPVPHSDSSGSFSIFAKDVLICKIVIEDDFDIRLHVSSQFLKQSFALYRRAVNPWLHANQYGRRSRLKDKPKFAKIATSLASTISKSYRTP